MISEEIKRLEDVLEQRLELIDEKGEARTIYQSARETLLTELLSIFQDKEYFMLFAQLPGVYPPVEHRLIYENRINCQ